MQHEQALNALQEEFQTKLNTVYSDLNEKIKKLTTKTTERDDGLDKMIKELESNTYWKVKDIEKLLEARPTADAVKEVAR